MAILYELLCGGGAQWSGTHWSGASTEAPPKLPLRQDLKDGSTFDRQEGAFFRVSKGPEAAKMEAGSEKSDWFS